MSVDQGHHFEVQVLHMHWVGFLACLRRVVILGLQVFGNYRLHLIPADESQVISPLLFTELDQKLLRQQTHG